MPDIHTATNTVNPYAPWDRLPPPPRKLPRTAIFKNLFGGGFSLFGNILLLAGALTLSSHLPITDFTAPRFSLGNTQNAKGVIYFRQLTGIKYKGADIEAVRYVYKDPAGQTAEGVSYAPMVIFKNMEVVDVEYLAADPSVSRIKDTRSKPVPLSGLLLIPLPLLTLGLAFSLSGFLTGRRRNALLAKGVFAQGVIANTQRFLFSSDARRLYKASASFRLPDDTQKTAVSSLLTPFMLKPGDPVPVLYDPQNPDQAEIPCFLVNKIQVSPDGSFTENMICWFYTGLAALPFAILLAMAAYWLAAGFQHPFAGMQ